MITRKLVYVVFIYFLILQACSSNVIKTTESKCILKEIEERHSPKSKHYIGIFNCVENKKIELGLDYKKYLEREKLKSKKFYIRTQTVKTCLFGICQLFDCNGLED